MRGIPWGQFTPDIAVDFIGNELDLDRAARMTGAVAAEGVDLDGVLQVDVLDAGDAPVRGPGDATRGPGQRRGSA